MRLAPTWPPLHASRPYMALPAPACVQSTGFVHERRRVFIHDNEMT